MTQTKQSTVNYPYVETDKEQSNSLAVARREYILSQEATTVKSDTLFIWNKKYQRWHKCQGVLRPPHLTITEYDDMCVDINEEQLLHLRQKWYHGSLTRREAKCTLQDHEGGNGSFLVRTSESYHGKFAISFMHESRVKHVVVESKRDPVAHMMYHITPNGPYFNSLYALIEEARCNTIIQNHVFDMVLGSSPAKPDISWLHHRIMSSSQAGHIMRMEHRDGAFFVHKTQSSIVPYVLLLRAGGSIQEHLVVATQRPGAALTLHGVTAPVLYKLIDYFMENPIVGSTILKYPIPDLDSRCSNCALSLKAYSGDSSSELSFVAGSLITDVQLRTSQWSIGSYRGDKNKWFPSEHVRFLSTEELLYVKEMHSEEEVRSVVNDVHIVDWSEHNLMMDVTVNAGSGDPEQIHLQSTTNTPVFSRHDYLLSAATSEDLRQWYLALREAKLLDLKGVVVNKRGHTSKEVAIVVLPLNMILVFLFIPAIQ